MMQKSQRLQKLEVYYAAQQEAYKKLFKQYWYDRALDDPDLTDDYIPQVDIEDFQTYIGKRSKKGRYKYLMFTINFKEETALAPILKKFEKYLTKKWILHAFSCMEWRDIDRGLHIHSRVEIKDDKNPYECKREVYNTFKELVGNKMHINVRYSNTETAFIEYIKGKKKGKEKSCMTATRLMRKKYDIPNTWEINKKPKKTISNEA